MDEIRSMSDVESPDEREIGPSWKVANPAPLALFAFGFMTAFLQGATTKITDDQPTKDFTACFAIFFGGLMPFIAGMWEMWKNNSFAAVAFMSYGGFWLSWGLYMILKSANVWTGQSSNTPIPDYSLIKTQEMMLSLWGIITFCFFIQTLRINRVLQVVFFSLMVLFFLLAGGIRSETCNKVAGWWGMWVAFICFYAATAILTVDVWGHEYLPLWHVKMAPPAAAVQRSVGSVASSADRPQQDK
ncbi:hypothetical protein COCSUDRAFT_44355 [Coccomyxa subellipsoidea C-169]|uniref:Uncharacterized protein n=1 Tax=Coccomyxa subellipsoidea (strain C-169) TaxID=574566 RepID=I0YNJ0_COCSC|nr:hypothetical protein COCSUDRAFT_44355 [Coccomyxa subellipsoidea C-169]EIE19959.1 hypothetical protein COCSUDRAFT_44355 [Coccomyxa subellipsoidea C-169]|eukprot:XP_005644503.1 hypothetical protein COCSUDRAFT_44355 [Coccomyxa subellipsoidea C-169]